MSTQNVTPNKGEAAPVVNINEQLDREEREERERNERVLGLTRELIGLRQQFGASVLAQGRILAALRDDLHRQFYKHVAIHIPAFSKATITRYIAMWESGRTLLPRTVLAACIAANVDIIGFDKRQPYGKFSAVVKKFPVPENPTDVEAEQWVGLVLTNYRDTRKGGNKRAIRVEAAVERAVRAVVGTYNRLTPKNQTTDFLMEVFANILGECGIDEPLTVAPAAREPEDEEQAEGGKRGRKAA